MKYLTNRDTQNINEDIGETEDSYVEILSSEEFRKRYEKRSYHPLFSEYIRNIQYCKAEVLRNGIIGTFLIPGKNNLTKESTTFGFYLTREMLIFVDDSGKVKDIVEDIRTMQTIDNSDVAQFFFSFTEYLIREDAIFLQEYEKRLATMEEELLGGNLEDFDKRMLIVRKELLTLQSYYEQLIDISDIFEENKNHLFQEEECRLFHLLFKRVDRLFDNTKMLKEYSMQIRELHETQIGTRQNEIMKFLTVVTTIFMPLTLIAGWYGMNFIHMPELQSPFGYAAVICVTVIIILLEIWLFKIKKWFR